MRRMDLLTICELEENKDKDIWLSESALNDIFGQAKYVRAQGEKLEIAFKEGPNLIIKHEGFVIGEFEAAWLIVNFGKYYRNTIIPTKKKGCNVL